MKRSGPYVTALLAGLASGTSAQLLATLYVRSREGFGSGDLSGYAIWNIAFAGFIVVLNTLLHRRLSLPKPGFRRLAWGIIGGFAGLAWTWIVAETLGPWILAFSFPVLYIWSIAGIAGGLIMGQLPASPNPLKWKRFWALLAAPCAALILSIAVTWGSVFGSRYLWGRKTPESFIFPDGFVGQAYLIRDTVDAPRAAIVEGRSTYTFDASGILRTGTPSTDGWLDQRFYYRKPDGSLAKLSGEWVSTIPDNPVTRADTTAGVYFVHWGQRASGDGCSVSYMSFFIGRQVDVLDKRGVDNLVAYLDAHPLCPTRARP
jgi:hypothetical protein